MPRSSFRQAQCDASLTSNGEIRKLFCITGFLSSLFCHQDTKALSFTNSQAPTVSCIALLWILDIDYSTLDIFSCVYFLSLLQKLKDTKLCYVALGFWVYKIYPMFSYISIHLYWNTTKKCSNCLCLRNPGTWDKLKE